MKKIFKKRSFLITFIIIIIAIIINSAIIFFKFKIENKIVFAGTTQNISGFAWSSNIGWISFNSSDCDADGNLKIDGGNCGSDNFSIDAKDYGVNLDCDNNFLSGNAWSPNIGWISFDRNFTGNPPAEPYMDPANTFISTVDNGTGKVQGWAKILSLNNNGWLKLSDDSVGVWNSKGVKIESDGFFTGWAWNANNDGSGIGWVSFNNLNTGFPIEYSVKTEIETKPEIIDQRSPNWYYDDAGRLGALGPVSGGLQLSWAVKSRGRCNVNQKKYQIILTEVETGDILNTGQVVSDSYAYIIPKTFLDYDKSYSWILTVWTTSKFSDPTPYNYEPDTNNITDENLPTFRTYKHEMPEVDFTLSRPDASKNEEVAIEQNTFVYTDAEPNTNKKSCDYCFTNPSTCSCSYEWTFNPQVYLKGDLVNLIGTSNASSTIIVLPSKGTFNVTLKVTDQSGYYISLDKDINSNYSLPKWKETKTD